VSAELAGAATWRLRIDRSTVLAETAAPARELLRFYVDLLDLQEPLFYIPAAAAWLDQIPRAQLRDLPVDSVAEDLARFLDDLGRIGTERIQTFTTGLASGDALDLVISFLRAAPEERGNLGGPASFVARSFLEPFAVRLAAAHEHESTPEAGSLPVNADSLAPVVRACPFCEEPPLLTVIGADADRPGAQQAQCPLCSTAWVYPRLTCTACGTSTPDHLRQHNTDTWPHITLQSCESCRHYAKIVDLRVEGRAVPVVDDIASTELDLWARDQGWSRVRGHLLDP